MKKKRIAALLLTAALAVGSLAGCGGDGGEKGGSDSPGGNSTPVSGNAEAGDNTGDNDGDAQGDAAQFIELDHNISGDLSILCWSGDGNYYEDIGHQNWAPEDITAINVASIYAMAKKFNETYPNVKINLLAMGDWE